MAEGYYTIPETPKYNEKIRRIQNSDPVNAETVVNPVIEALIENTAAVKMTADQANGTANAAKTAAGEAKNTAGGAQETANAALEAANSAQSAAGGAQTTADAAMELANTANTTAQGAKSTADTALSTANEAKSAAQSAQTAATNAQTAANAALEQLTKVANTLGAVPTQNGTPTYTGSEQSLVLNNYDSGKMTLGGATSATDAGTYTATVKPKGDYVWPDGTQNTVNITWTISKASLTVPSQSGSLTYTGLAQSPVLSGYDSAKMTLGGTSSAINAGSHTATVTPKANYQWSDGTTSAKNVTWTIGKAAGNLSLSATSLKLSVSSLTGTVTAIRSGDGAVSATSSNTSVAEVSVSGTTITITGKKKGSATIKVSVAAGTNHNAPSNKTIAVTVDMPTAILADNTPATIQAVAKAGAAPNYWSVGDKIGIAVNGSFGDLSYNGTVYAFILGFNHNSDVEGGNSIHFQFGKTSAGVDIAFFQSGSTTKGFCMNTNSTNSGGWESSYMRQTICQAFLSALPTEWQNVIVACTKYSDNKGGGRDTASYVTSTSDKIWLLSEFEVLGGRSWANSAEQNYQKQYDYYKNGNSKVKYKHSETTSACHWWTRSVKSDNAGNFVGISTSGGVTIATAYLSIGFAPGFKVA